MMKALNIKMALTEKYNFLGESVLASQAFPFGSIFLSLPNMLSANSGIRARESLGRSNKYHLFILGLNDRF